MAERISKHPDWSFKRDKLVTVLPIRRARLDDEWLGDESAGIPAADLERKIREKEEAEHREAENVEKPIIYIDTTHMSPDDLSNGY